MTELRGKMAKQPACSAKSSKQEQGKSSHSLVHFLEVSVSPDHQFDFSKYIIIEKSLPRKRFDKIKGWWFKHDTPIPEKYLGLPMTVHSRMEGEDIPLCTQLCAKAEDGWYDENKPMFRGTCFITLKDETEQIEAEKIRRVLDFIHTCMRYVDDLFPSRTGGSDRILKNWADEFLKNEWNNPTNKYVCSNPECLKISKSLKRCGKCLDATYCDGTCQLAHWKSHKISCRKSSAPSVGSKTARATKSSPVSHGEHGSFVIIDHPDLLPQHLCGADKLYALFTLPSMTPDRITEVTADLFFYSLTHDYFPSEDIELMFGTPMENPVNEFEVSDRPTGKIVYAVWQGLYKLDLITKDEVMRELRGGTLPRYFEMKVLKQAEDTPRYALGEYVPELLKRGFDNIIWDTAAHRYCAQK